MLSLCELGRAIAGALGGEAPVPLLVLRLPELERIAWREGKLNARRVERLAAAAFCRAAQRIVRDGDLLAHESGSDCFVVALLAPGRLGRLPGAGEARAALERIAAAMSLSTGRRWETGWLPVETCAQVEQMNESVEAALARGGREREHREMLATVGHELRTPLTSIRGYLETLLDDEVDASTARRFLETARREALRLGRLVDGMLEFSMLDLSARPNGPGCDVAEQIRATVDAIAPLASERGTAIRTRLPERAIVRLDADACMHVLLNLAENAVKHGRRGGVIEIACVCEEAFARIAIDDDGPGIAAPDRASIFVMGVRGGARRPGAGIGLALVQAIVARSGGAVSAMPSPLGGARFELCLPVAGTTAWPRSRSGENARPLQHDSEPPPS